jgi:hypothetical protein
MNENKKDEVLSITHHFKMRKKKKQKLCLKGVKKSVIFESKSLTDYQSF